MTVTLTFQEIRLMAARFDQAQGSSAPTEDDYVTFNYMAGYRSLALNVNQYIVDTYLPSNPSVIAMLDLYSGAPQTQGRPILTDLNAASKVILQKLNKRTSAFDGELNHFKQLLDLVLEPYFNQSPAAGKIEILRKLRALPDTLARLELISVIPDPIRQIDQLRMFNATIASILPPDKIEQLNLELSKLLQYVDGVKADIKRSYASRYSLLQYGFGFAILPFSAVTALIKPSVMSSFTNSKMRQFLLAWYVIYIVTGQILLFYETVICPLAGFALCKYHLFRGLNPIASADELIANHIFSQRKRFLPGDVSPAVLEKWHNSAIEIIVDPTRRSS